MLSVLFISLTLTQTISTVGNLGSATQETPRNTPSPGSTSVTVSLARDLIESAENLLVLDVRSEVEYFAGHIGQAINIPLYVLEDRIDELDRRTPILVYSDQEQDSAAASKKLVARGFNSVFSMLGGVEAWKHAQLPLDSSTEDAPTAQDCPGCSGNKTRKKTKVERMEASRIEQELRNIKTKIREKNAKWNVKETGVSRLAFKHRKQLFTPTFGPAKVEGEVITLPGDLTIPFGTFDWRNVNGIDWMTPVKNQGACGSCWAFGTLGSMEAVINIRMNDPTIDMDLSEQVLVSCCRGYYPLCGFGCSGGYPEAAYNYIKNNGVPDEDCFRYVASDVACNRCSDWTSRAWFITNWAWVSNNRASIKWALQTYGPLGVAMRAPDDFLYYGEGVYTPVWSSGEWDKEFPLGQANHWVTLVGYDDNGGYWIVKNSWGQSWGEAGYGKIAYGVLEGYDYILAITSIQGPTAPEHDLRVTLQAPGAIHAGGDARLNATVHNDGLNDETNVRLSLLANGTEIASRMIPTLTPGASESLSYTWTQSLEGWYNITAYSAPVPNENVVSNNAATDWTAVTDADVLLVVDDDGSYSIRGTSQDRFETALTNAGLDYLVWVESVHDRPGLDVLGLFQAVVWTCGDYWDGAVDSVDAGGLQSYLDRGGAVLLEGEDIGFDHRSDIFMSTVAHAYYEVDYVGSSGIHKTDPTHPIAQGLPQYMYWQVAPSWDDGVTPWNGGSEVFEYYNPSTYSAIVVYGLGADSSTAYLAYPLYSMSQADANALVMNTIGWLGGCLLTFDANPRVTSLTVDGVTYGASQLPKRFSWRSGSSHSFSVEDTIPIDAGRRYVFTRWSDGDTSTSRTLTVTASTTYTAYFETQYALSIFISPSGAGTTTPSADGSPHWEEADTTVSVTETPNAGYSFYYWSLDGVNVGSGPSYSVVMNSAHALTAFFRGTSSISLGLSAESIPLDASVTLSGMISPAQPSPSIPAGTIVILSHSLDGATWNTFIMTQVVDGGGRYSIVWYPPYPNAYQIKAAWSGNQNYEGSTSPVVSLTVTGTQASVTLLISEPASTARGSSATLDGLVVSPVGSDLTTVYIYVVGPGGYRYFDTQQVSLDSRGITKFQFVWQVPSSLAPGAYQIYVGLIPPKPTAIAQTQITIT